MATAAIERRAKREFALKTMLLVLGDRAAGSSGFYEDDPVFADVPPATWTGLARKQYVRIVDFMGGRPVCFLTGAGWKTAVEVSGHANIPGFIDRRARVAAHLSELVRGQPAPVQVSLYQVAAETGVAEGFIWNLIESRVMGPNAPRWDGKADGLYLIEVPVGFGEHF